MSTDDPRELGGGIAGPGGPFDSGAVVFDTRNAVLMDTTEVAKLDNPSDGRAFFGMVLAGRVNRTDDRTQVLYLFDTDGAAALITELHGLAERAGWTAELIEACEERWRTMPHRPDAGS